jgi:resuscitation-promoting factor RpfB
VALRLPRPPRAVVGRRAAHVAGQALLVSALVGGTAVYAAADTTVTLSVDGEQQEVRAFGGTVADILDKADVDVASRDVVAPALGTEVEDGDEVVVRHARELRLTVDGEDQTLWTTALTVDAALAEAGLRVDGAALSASRSQRLGRSGMDLEVSTPKTVSVVADGATNEVVTTGTTVAEALSEAGVTVGEADTVSVPVTSPAVDGLVVAVTRITTRQTPETSEVAFGTEEKKTDALYAGQTKVERAGTVGQRTVTYTETLADGTVVKRDVVKDDVTTAPVSKVVLVGTKQRPAAAPATRSSGSSSRQSAPAAPAVSGGSAWDRLAQCEAGGNWSINTGNGYYGGLQFSAASWRAVGGTGLPHQASRATQIQMGERLKAAQGWGAWPSCSRKLGLR